MLERDAHRVRAVQVGMLMRAYRESFQEDGNARGITQDQLLHRMSEVDGDFAQRYSHSTVSRWESGVTRPSRERLEVFGRALNLSPAEVQGLISLAGVGDIDSGVPYDAELCVDDDNNEQATASGVEPHATGVNPPGTSPHACFRRGPMPTLPQGVVSCVLPGLVIIGGSYLLASIGWNDSWMPVAYIGAAVGARLAGAFLRLNQPYDLCEFLCISLFVCLSTPLLQSAALNMDHYGFSSIPEFAGTPMPYAIALLVNLGLSTAAGATLFALWNWQYARSRLPGNAVRRAALCVCFPVGLVYAILAAITNTGILLQLGLVFTVLSVVCIILLLLRDPTVNPQERDRRFLLWAILLVGMVMSSLGAAVVIVIFLTPNVPSMLPDHNLFYSWVIDFDGLDMPTEEALRRFNIGYLWHATATFVYMLFIVGGKLLAATYDWGNVPAHAPYSRAQTGDPQERAYRASSLGRVRAFLRIFRPSSRR